ncbi:MAG: HAMP domain-containing histidine kinase [Acidobacteria bacterium]|nr:HAMP domain-containing histidine kinase [Acidobacteriota bacterium]
MDVLLLGAEQPVTKFLREHITAATPSRVSFSAFSAEDAAIPKSGRWDLIVIDRKVKANAGVAEAILTDRLEGIKIVLTEKGHLRSATEFWGTGIYSYLLKPINRQLFQLVWQNVRERIHLGRKLSRLQTQRQRDRAEASEHQEILKDLFTAHLRMQELEQEKTKFLAQTAHELRTPLTALKGYLSLLSNDKVGPVNPLQLELVNCSLHTCQRLLRLTHSLADLSALTGQRNQLQFQESKIEESIQRAVAELQPAAEAKGLQFSLDCAVDLPLVRFDLDRMQQVFVNLLDNAVKYTPAGGRVAVRCGLYFWDRRMVRETVHARGDLRRQDSPPPFNSVQVVVEDSGIGISPEVLPQIFQEYCRGTNGNGKGNGNGNTGGKGFGLGLAVARQIVAAHEGRIWAESELGVGSRFAVLLPTQS